VTSKRDVSKNEVIRYVTKFGKPLIVAADVNPMPKSVRLIAKSMGCRAFYPQATLSVVEKVKLAGEYVKRRNKHETAALAAGLKAYKSYKEFLHRVEAAAEEAGVGEAADEALILMMRKESENITNAIRALKRKIAKRGR